MIGESKYHLFSIIVAVTACLAMYFYLNYHKHGFELTVVGESEKTARYVGIKVDRVIISLNLNHCPANTEPAIVNKVESRLGTKGFVFARDGIFCSDYLTALTMGYDKGIMNLTYYMHFNESVPQEKKKRN